nr:MAG TPA: hypothetical protein [Caudoviricetes sp.]
MKSLYLWYFSVVFTNTEKNLHTFWGQYRCHRHRPKEAWLQVPWFHTHLLIPSEHRYD